MRCTGTTHQGFVRDAPMVMVVSGVAARTTPRFEDLTDRLIDMEVGHVDQTVSLQAVVLGLGTVGVVAYRDTEPAAALQLAEGERAVYRMPVGRAAQPVRSSPCGPHDEGGPHGDRRSGARRSVVHAAACGLVRFLGRDERNGLEGAHGAGGADGGGERHRRHVVGEVADRVEVVGPEREVVRLELPAELLDERPRHVHARRDALRRAERLSSRWPNLGLVDLSLATDADGNVYAAGHTSGDDVARGIASDAAGNVYATGHTAGTFEGSNLGGGGAFIRSYDSAGILRWTRQFGTSRDLALGIATDATGDVYVTGSTTEVSGNPGLADAFIRKYGP